MLNALGFTTSYDFNTISLTHISNSVVTLGNNYTYIHVTTDLIETYYTNTIVNYLATIPISEIPSSQAK